MSVADVISLLGGIALFLFGMSLMGEGLKKVAGSRLELVLYKLSSTPLKGVLLGTGVTAVIQSSSATSVMVVGFVNSGMMQVKQAITGYGKAVKKQIQEMTRIMLHLESVPKPDDTADALGMAIAHCHCSRSRLMGTPVR